MTISRPPFITVPLAAGLKWRGGGGCLYEEKMDGVWSVRTIGPAILAGEQMRDGRFFAFDLLAFAGHDIRRRPLRDRLAGLDALCRELVNRKSQIENVLRVAAGHGAEFLEAVLARGGEGVVAKHLDAPYGAPWYKCKREETLDLLVTDKACPSIRLAAIPAEDPSPTPQSAIRNPNSEDRGWCCARAMFDQIKIGDIVEIKAFGLTSRGKLREPRFLRLRPDKSVPPLPAFPPC
jgi:ATP dependent DNA ligase-like protein